MGGMMETIPPITDPLGVHWKQPERTKIEIDNTHALMNEATFEQLLEYSCSQPTAVYYGKMWKRLQNNIWYLCWFGKGKNSDFCSNNYRIILKVEGT
jgi:hypothetical protein